MLYSSSSGRSSSGGSKDDTRLVTLTQHAGEHGSEAEMGEWLAVPDEAAFLETDEKEGLEVAVRADTSGIDSRQAADEAAGELGGRLLRMQLAHAAATTAPDGDDPWVTAPGEDHELAVASAPLHLVLPGGAGAAAGKAARAKRLNALQQGSDSGERTLPRHVRRTTARKIVLDVTMEGQASTELGAALPAVLAWVQELAAQAGASEASRTTSQTHGSRGITTIVDIDAMITADIIPTPPPSVCGCLHERLPPYAPADLPTALSWHYAALRLAICQFTCQHQAAIASLLGLEVFLCLLWAVTLILWPSSDDISRSHCRRGTVRPKCHC